MKTPETRELEIETANIKEAALLFRAINHKLRRQILTLMHENKKMSVTPLYRKLGLEQSVASSHLAILRKADILVIEKEGRSVYYSVNYQRL
jgi:DNA-binding transcriptional ArsR family regulator